MAVAANKGNMFAEKRQSYQPGLTQKKTPLDVVSPAQTKMGELDDDDDHEDDDGDEDADITDQSAQHKGLEESKDHDENVRDDDHMDNSRASNASKKNLRDVARKLWLAVEVGDKMGVL